MSKLFLLSGSAEYRSTESLTRWLHNLEALGHQPTLVDVAERAKTVPQLSELATHDVLIVFCKRLELDASERSLLQDWCRAGRPVFGLRTASHAFQSWLEFDSEILGGSYSGHGELEDVEVNPVADSHSITSGMSTWQRPGTLYRNPRLDPSCVRLLDARGVDGIEPVAWCRQQPETGGRVFYSSLGAPNDFGNTDFLAFLDRALVWVAADKA